MRNRFATLLGQFGQLQLSARSPSPRAPRRPSIEDRLIALFRRYA